MNTTTLADLLAAMDTWQDIARIEEQHKVRQLDAAIRKLRRETYFPWTLKKSTLKVFSDVFEYPTASDHDAMAYLDVENQDRPYAQRTRFFYTSLQQFYEDSNNSRNLMAEIWDNGVSYLGVRYKDFTTGNTQLSNAETLSYYTASGDASGAVLDNVTYKEGNGSIRFTVTYSTGTVTMKNTFTAISDSNYKKKYHFRWIYLAVAPTSITLRLQTDDSNYLYTTVTTQFSGQAFKAGQWNLVAHDLNAATETGTFNSASIASEKIILTIASASNNGTYYVDNSSLKEWTQMDYWYYSKYNCATNGATVPDQEFFYSSGSYSTDTSLVGDKAWADVIMYDALVRLIADVENVRVFSMVNREREEAWKALRDAYPDMTPLITTQKYRFSSDFNQDYLNDSPYEY